MKNIKKLDYISRRETIKLTRNEKKVADTIALPIALVVSIVFYFWRCIIKVLFKSKRYLYRISIISFMVYNAYTALSLVALAPKPAHALDGVKHTYNIPSLDPNISEREQNIALINKIWGNDASIGLEIARCESGYRTLATHYNSNYTVDQGIFQYNSVHNLPQMDTAVANIEAAYLMYQQQGTTPWNSSKECWQ